MGKTALKRDILVKECIERIKYRVELDRSRVITNFKKLVDMDYLKLNSLGEILYNP